MSLVMFQTSSASVLRSSLSLCFASPLYHRHSLEALSRAPPSRPRPPFASLPTMSSSSSTQKSLTVVKKKAVEATPENFAEFGQVILSSPDGDEFGPQDAQLELHRGTPRFYIMQLKGRALKFRTITHHASVTQCLGSVGGAIWYLGVAKTTIVNEKEISNANGERIVQSTCGHHYIPPRPDDVKVFRISGPKFLKLNVGTWHAGPLFDVEALDFYNLELSDTNVVDHTTHDFSKEDRLIFVIEK